MFVKPEDITKKEFTFSKGMYKSDEVDEYLLQVKSSYEQCYASQAQLVEQNNKAQQKIAEYKENEDNVKAALIVAQRAAKELLSEAEKKSQAMIEEATEASQKQKTETLQKCKQVIEKAKHDAETITKKNEERLEELRQAIENAEKEKNETIRICAEQIEKYKKIILNLHQKQEEILNASCAEFYKNYRKDTGNTSKPVVEDLQEENPETESDEEYESATEIESEAEVVPDEEE